MLDELTTSPSTALQVAIATVAIYVVFLLLIRVLGQRSLATLSAVDVVCVLALGAIVGRTPLLVDPSLVSGVVALTTLLVARRLTASAAHLAWVERILQHPPIVLVRNGRLVPHGLSTARVTHDQLRHQLRLAGVTTLADVRYAVLERTGQISVLRGDHPVDGWMVEDLPNDSPDRTGT